MPYLLRAGWLKAPSESNCTVYKKNKMWVPVIQTLHSWVYMLLVGHELVKVFQGTRSHGTNLKIWQYINLSLVCLRTYC